MQDDVLGRALSLAHPQNGLIFSARRIPWHAIIELTVDSDFESNTDADSTSSSSSTGGNSKSASASQRRLVARVDFPFQALCTARATAVPWKLASETRRSRRCGTWRRALRSRSRASTSTTTTRRARSAGRGCSWTTWVSNATYCTSNPGQRRRSPLPLAHDEPRAETLHLPFSRRVLGPALVAPLPCDRQPSLCQRRHRQRRDSSRPAFDAMFALNHYLRPSRARQVRPLREAARVDPGGGVATCDTKLPMARGSNAEGPSRAGKAKIAPRPAALLSRTQSPTSPTCPSCTRLRFRHIPQHPAPRTSGCTTPWCPRATHRDRRGHRLGGDAGNADPEYPQAGVAVLRERGGTGRAALGDGGASQCGVGWGGGVRRGQGFEGGGDARDPA